MLNERKIRLMTKTAIYEKGKGKADLKMNKYSGSDFVRFNMLKSFLAATIAMVLIAFLIIGSKMESVMNDVLKMDIAKLGRELLVLYIVFIIIYVVFSLIFYQQKYHRAKKRIRRYNQNLQKIACISKMESAARYEEDEYYEEYESQEE